VWWQELIDGYASNADARLGMDQCTVGFAGETTFGTLAARPRARQLLSRNLPSAPAFDRGIMRLETSTKVSLGPPRPRGE
jgi:hypothetical protein